MFSVKTRRLFYVTLMKDRKQLTLLREAEVDHLRGNRRAEVEVSQHVLKWFVCCLRFFPAELRNSSNQSKQRRQNKQTYYRKRSGISKQMFYGVCLIQSQFAAVLIVHISFLKMLILQISVLQMSYFWLKLNRTNRISIKQKPLFSLFV